MADVAEPRVKGLLVKVRTGPGGNVAALRWLGAAEPILEVPAGPRGRHSELSASEPAIWMRATPATMPGTEPTACERRLCRRQRRRLAAEPDFDSLGRSPSARTSRHAGPSRKAREGGRAVGPGRAWHLERGLIAASRRPLRRADG